MTALFITFEGGEGCGKSTQAKELYRRLSELSIPVVLTHEPGGTPLGEKIASWLKEGHDMNISPLTELMLFNASRAQLIYNVIKPALEGGQVVICDRYADSTTVYQGYGRGLDLAMVRTTNDAATGGLKPNLTVLLDAPVETGLGRKRDREDRFEQETIAFHQRVRQGFLELAAGEPERWMVIDTAKPKEAVSEIIWQRVSKMLPGRGE